MANAKPSPIIFIKPLERQTMSVVVMGTTPLFFNRMSEKAKQMLLAGGGKKDAAEKAASAKHDPIAEFRSSPYTFDSSEAPTFLALPSTAFKGAMATAAIDIPGAVKAKIERLVYVEGDKVPVYGTPRLCMSVVRNSDINHTPDIRTRAVLREWVAVLEVTFVSTLLKAQSIQNLLSTAGVTVGVGDWRTEKGSWNRGSFDIVDADHPDVLRLMTEGRATQIAAMEAAEPFDDESAELLSWFGKEMKMRGFDGTLVSAGRNGFVAVGAEA